jgi:hypothetical protein
MHLYQVLVDEVWKRRLGRPPALRGYPSVWAGVEIWSKLDRLPPETEILRLELVINKSDITRGTTGCIKCIRNSMGWCLISLQFNRLIGLLKAQLFSIQAVRLDAV